MKGRQYDFLVVGSGAGGATLARELTRRGRSVLVVERGQPELKIGTIPNSLRYYDLNPLTRLPIESKEGVILWRAFMAGGSTVVSCGNGVRCLEEELAALGVDLKAELDEAEREMGVTALKGELRAESSNLMLEVARRLGYQMNPMPKFVDPEKCRKCGQCILGCRHGAKWTALDYLNEAQRQGAEVRFGTRVQRVLIENGKVQGVQINGAGGAGTLSARVVIVAAGGLETPVILQQSGIAAGEGLFVDLMHNTYGVVPGMDSLHEPTMAMVNHEFHRSRGFILSPFANHSSVGRFMELGARGMTMPSRNVVGIMTKTVDDSTGRVYPDGSISKAITPADQARLDAGAGIAREILLAMGANPNSIVTSRTQGAHPGGTSAIGRVVDRDLQTSVEGLFICDSSVLPIAPGLPPIVTLAALAKRLARTLGG